jgi:hypothetical protein
LLEKQFPYIKNKNRVISSESLNNIFKI